MNWFSLSVRLSYLVILVAIVVCLGGSFLVVRGAFNVVGAFLTPATPTPNLAASSAAPTGAAISTVVPTPAASATPTPKPESECIGYLEAKQHIGETKCVRGVVFNTYSTKTAFFVDFDGTATEFFGTSLKGSLENLIGRCVELTGEILDYKGRPYIVFEPNDLKSCR